MDLKKKNSFAECAYFGCNAAVVPLKLATIFQTREGVGVRWRQRGLQGRNVLLIS